MAMKGTLTLYFMAVIALIAGGAFMAAEAAVLNNAQEPEKKELMNVNECTESENSDMETPENKMKMVRELCDTIMKKLYISAPIEDIVECHNSRERSHTTLDIDRPGEYFPWRDVLASMYEKPEKVEILSETCPDCGGRLVSFYFSSPTWTWMHLCGRAGTMTICPDCPKQLDFNLEIMN